MAYTREKGKSCPLPGVDPGSILFPYIAPLTAAADFDMLVPWNARLVHVESVVLVTVNAALENDIVIEHNDGTTQTTLGTITIGTGAAANDLDEATLLSVAQRNFVAGEKIRLNVTGNDGAEGVICVVCLFEPCTS